MGTQHSGGAVRRFIEWLSRRLGPNMVLWATLVCGGLLVAGLAALSAEVYDAVAESDGVAALDHPVLAAALTLRSPGLSAAVTAYTNIGGVIGMPILAVAAVVVLSIISKSWRPTILILMAAAGSLAMTIAGKRLIGRDRPSIDDAVPPYEHSASFPSGHTLNATVIAGTIAYLIVLLLKSLLARILTIAAAALFAVSMGLSRVYLGHHWLTDVIVAWTLGLAWLALVILAHRLFLMVRAERRGQDPVEAGKIT